MTDGYEIEIQFSDTESDVITSARPWKFIIVGKFSEEFREKYNMHIRYSLPGKALTIKKAEKRLQELIDVHNDKDTILHYGCKMFEKMWIVETNPEQITTDFHIS